ncbi:MAG TPA: TIGR04084 family radical SAM/SPASM domain-containing protein [Nanoarchaeota archaeon]|nr:TIGR04084 family radical SAM/SPASM domain-containing protein [Nanoarchaeota archaeon]
MYFHIIMSIDCNSECRYCYKKSYEDFGNDLNRIFKFDFSMPPMIKYKIEELKAFVEKSKSRQTLTFYGGEPLMDIEKIKEIMASIDARYMMQTNGLLLDKLPNEYVNRFEAILVSIDGNKNLTDFNRGKGTYDRVLANIHLIRKNGFNGELIARMVVDEVSEKTGLTENVKHLFSIGFDAVHWQLDAGFYQQDFKNRNFAAFAESYNAEVSGLLGYWIETMKKEGRVLRIYPFLGIFESLYYGKKEKLRCGSGYANYTIATNGKISVCPIMHDATEFQVGDIWQSSPDKLKEIHVSEPCKSCGILDLCGGRCLYANKANLWPKQGQEIICNTVRHLISAVQSGLPEIKALITSKKISEKQFEYEKYTGPEIIP